MFNLKKEKEFKKQEVALYKRDLILKADEEVMNYRQDCMYKIKELGTVSGIGVKDMVDKFGWRIRRAVVMKDGKPHGLSSVKLVKILRWWKFWNKDIRKAYKAYVGILYVPWTIEYGKPEVTYNEDIDWDEFENAIKEEMSQEIKEKYKRQVNPNYYTQLKIVPNDDKT